MARSRPTFWILLVLMFGAMGVSSVYLSLPNQIRADLRWKWLGIEGSAFHYAITKNRDLSREMSRYYRAEGHYPFVRTDDGVTSASTVRQPFRLPEDEGPHGKLLNDLAADAFRSSRFRQIPSWYVTNGQIYVFISTGPDLDIDIPMDLPMPCNGGDFLDRWRTPYVYDPTNGLNSSGDYLYFGQLGEFY